MRGRREMGLKLVMSWMGFCGLRMGMITVVVHVCVWSFRIVIANSYLENEVVYYNLRIYF